MIDRRLKEEGGSEAATALRTAAIATAALGVVGDVTAALCGVPMVAGAALAGTLPRWRGLVLIPALFPFLAQLMVMGAAAASFGFRWRGGAIEAVLLAILFVTGVGSIVLVRIHRPAWKKPERG